MADLTVTNMVCYHRVISYHVMCCVGTVKSTNRICANSSQSETSIGAIPTRLSTNQFQAIFL